MKTFIVLIPVKGEIVDARKACERIENIKFTISKHQNICAGRLIVDVCIELGLKTDCNIELESLTDFMDRVNNEEFDSDQYFMSYVHVE